MLQETIQGERSFQLDTYSELSWILRMDTTVFFKFANFSHFLHKSGSAVPDILDLRVSQR
jgi:hypothetical protein